VLAALLLAGAVVTDSRAAGPWRADATNTEGWLDMSPAERVEHQRRMRGFSSFEECATYQSTQRRRVRERAGHGAPPKPGREGRASAPARDPRPSTPASADGCHQLRAQGRWR